jgi:hypothetical protein
MAGVPLRWVKPWRYRACPNPGLRLPSFFDDVPRLRVHDALAEALGCADGGLLEYSYADAVRLTGHSCPTVAAAYWLTWLSLHALYGDAPPERGGVLVEFREDPRTGSTGVVAAVVQMLTGAAGGSGFKGLGGRFSRVGLQRLAPDLPLSLRYTRLDSGEAVDATADLSLAPVDTALDELLDRCTGGKAGPADWTELGQRWQRRVKALLLDLAHDPGVFVVRRVERRPRRAPPAMPVAAGFIPRA